MYGNDQLFTSAVPVGDLLLVLPAGVARDKIGLDEAWSSTSLSGIFVYAAAGLPVTAESANQFIEAVLQRVRRSPAPRGFLWADPGIETGPLMGLNETAGESPTGLDADIASGLSFRIGASAALSLSGSIVQISGAEVGYSGDRAPSPASAVTTAWLQLDGTGAGVISYEASFTGSSLRNASSWGLQFTAGNLTAAMWLPFAAAPADPVSFVVAMDPSSPLNGAAGAPVRSRMSFDDRQGKIVLASSYRTMQGAPVSLIPKTTGPDQPAGLVFDRGAAGRSVMLTPVGDFEMSTAGGPEPAYLMCGLTGTEAIIFQPQRASSGDRIRFVPYQPAYAPGYPFGVTSPVAPPADLSAPLLDATYTTSWATVMANSSNARYVAQPPGSPLYGVGDSFYSSRNVLVWADPADALPPGVPFPMAGYGVPPAGWTAAQAADFERQVIAPVRRQVIGAPESAPAPRPGPGGAAAPYTVTTPSGQIVTITDGRWTSILLGRTTPNLTLCFTDPVLQLQQAFQTASLFLVVANGAYLGWQHSGDGKPDGGVNRWKQLR
ncbi:MAG TPA: hypothetical protein VKD26_10470 [Streptosporangiaceae bacterium]|nr:hypothetical protein [Streptosporangiaceae bacterium]